jgi:hypothetical protein
MIKVSSNARMKYFRIMLPPGHERMSIAKRESTSPD